MIDPFNIENREITIAPTGRGRPRRSLRKRRGWALQGTSLDPDRTDGTEIGVPGLAAALARCRKRLAAKLDLSAFKGRPKT